jgi:hypothetical protein
VLRRILRFYRPPVSIEEEIDIFKYILAILNAVGSQWPIRIFFEVCSQFCSGSMLWAFAYPKVHVAFAITCQIIIGLVELLSALKTNERSPYFKISIFYEKLAERIYLGMVLK